MSSSSEFIILMMAETFLTHDYEYCLRIGKCDFSFFCNTSLFEANLLRFVSMASAKLFEHAMREQPDDYMEHVDFLYQALLCATKAKQIYSAEHVQQEELEHEQAIALFSQN